MEKKDPPFCWLILLLLFLGGHLFGQKEEQKSAEQLWGDPVIELTLKNGLPDLHIKRMLQDEKGFIWIISYSSVSYFDGTEVRSLSLDTEGKTLFIDAVIDEKRNHLWVAHALGLFKINLHTLQSESILSSGEITNNGRYINTLYIDDSDRLWIGQNIDFGIYDLERNRFNQHKIETSHLPPFKINIVNCFQQDPWDKNIMWIATDNVFYQHHIQEGKFEEIGQDAKEHFYFQRTHQIKVDTFNNVLICMTKRNVHSLYMPQFIFFDPQEKKSLAVINLPFDWTPQSVFSNGVDGYWLSAREGIGLLNASTKKVEKVYGDATETSAPNIYFMDRDNGIWAKHESGLYRYLPKEQAVESFPYEPIETKGYHVCNELLVHHNKVYMSVFGGDGMYVFDLENEVWDIKVPPGLQGTERYFNCSVDVTQDDRVIAFSHSGIWYVDEPNMTLKPTPIVKNNYATGTLDPFQNYWTIYRDWIEKRNILSGEVTKIGMPFDSCYDVSQTYEAFIDPLQNVWFIGLCAGQIVYYDKKSEELKYLPLGNDGDQEDYSMKIVFNNQFTTVLTNQGRAVLIRYDDIDEGKIRSIDIANKLDLSGELQLLSGTYINDEELWLLTNLGLVQYDLNADEARLYSNVPLLDEELSVHAAENIERIDDRRLVYSTRKAIHMVYTDRLQQKAKRPQPFVSSLAVNNNAYHSDTTVIFKKNYVLKPHENFLTFEFSSLFFDNPEALEYSYQLEGLNDEWVSTKNRNVTFAYLDGGDYTFHVKSAFTPTENPEITSIDIRIQKKWYEKRWVQMLGGFFFLSIGYALYKIRVNQKIKQQKLRTEYERKMAEIKMNALTAQMNPHFIFNSLNSIDYYIIKNDAVKASQYLNKFSRLIRKILNHSRSNFVTLHEELEALKLYIEIENIRFEKKFEYVVSADPQIALHDIEIPPLLLQPYVENAIWHGLMHSDEKGRLTVNIKYDATGENILCLITDNGVGRAMASELKSKTVHRKSEKSMGMEITKDKIETINLLRNMNAKVEVIDLFDSLGSASGTRVVLTIPI